MASTMDTLFEAFYIVRLEDVSSAGGERKPPQARIHWAYPPDALDDSASPDASAAAMRRSEVVQFCFPYPDRERTYAAPREAPRAEHFVFSLSGVGRGPAAGGGGDEGEKAFSRAFGNCRRVLLPALPCEANARGDGADADAPRSPPARADDGGALGPLAGNARLDAGKR